jgi:hypothetical protein
LDTPTLIVILTSGLLVAWGLSALTDMGEHYRCDHPGCDATFDSEQCALGHQADHARHRTKRIE